MHRIWCRYNHQQFRESKPLYYCQNKHATTLLRNKQHHNQCKTYCLHTLTAVATTDPFGGLSLYLGVPATKMIIAMAEMKEKEEIRKGIIKKRTVKVDSRWRSNAETAEQTKQTTQHHKQLPNQMHITYIIHPQYQQNNKLTHHDGGNGVTHKEAPLLASQVRAGSVLADISHQGVRDQSTQVDGPVEPKREGKSKKGEQWGA